MIHAFKYFNGFWSMAVIMLIDVQILSSLATDSLFRLVLNYFLRTLALFLSFLAPQASYVIFLSSNGDSQSVISLQVKEWQYSNSRAFRNGDILILSFFLHLLDEEIHSPSTFWIS